MEWDIFCDEYRNQKGDGYLYDFFGADDIFVENSLKSIKIFEK